VNDDRSESSNSTENKDDLVIVTEESEGSEASDDSAEPESDQEESEDSEAEPAPTTRASGRQRRPPQWQTSGKFIMSSQVTDQTNVRTEHNLQLLSDLIASGLLKPDRETLTAAFRSAFAK
jgi:hypothetical protein